MGGACITIGGEEEHIQAITGKAKRKEPLGRPRCRCVDSIEMGLGDIDWIGLAQDRDKWRALVNVEMNLQVP
jgi:hypothetical protein